VFRGHESTVMAVAVSADGRRLISGGHDQRLIVWDAGSGMRLKTLSHTTGIRCMAISADGRRAISAGNDEPIHYWDLDEGRELRKLDPHGQWVGGVAI
jgi:WD40 repeat protein